MALAVAEVPVPLPRITGYVIWHEKRAAFATGKDGVVRAENWRDPPKVWRDLTQLKHHLEIALYVESFGHTVGDRVKRFQINGIYKGCQVVDLMTRKPVDFDIYKWYEQTPLVVNHVKAGYKLVYVE